MNQALDFWFAFGDRVGVGGLNAVTRPVFHRLNTNFEIKAFLSYEFFSKMKFKTFGILENFFNKASYGEMSCKVKCKKLLT